MRSVAKHGPRTPALIRARKKAALSKLVDHLGIARSFPVASSAANADRVERLDGESARPVHSSARPVSITTLSKSETVVDIGDDTLRLSEDERKALHIALSRSGGRSPSRTGRGSE